MAAPGWKLAANFTHNSNVAAHLSKKNKKLKNEICVIVCLCAVLYILLCRWVVINWWVMAMLVGVVAILIPRFYEFFTVLMNRWKKFLETQQKKSVTFSAVLSFIDCV